MAKKQAEWTCDDCATAYRLKIFTCPRCRGTRFTLEDGMAKISTFGGVTDVRASGLLPGVAGELPEQVVTRADGTSEVVNGEVEEVDEPASAPDDDDSDDSVSSDESDENGNRDNSDAAPHPDSGEDNDEDEDDGEPPFNPSPLTVAEVNLKLQGLTDEARERVLTAERAGKNRQGIIG